MSIKKNYLYNLLRVINQIIFPLITMPYVSRILSPESIGEVEYYMSISLYGIISANYGINQYGVIYLSKNLNQNKKKLTEIISFNLLSTFCGICIFSLLYFNLAVFNKKIYLLLCFRILLDLLKFEWYFVYKENFKFITLRDSFVKILFIILIFLSIKNSNDTLKYLIILICGDAVGNIFNSFKFFQDEKILLKDILKFRIKKIKKIFLNTTPFFIATLSTSFYLILDKIMLGKISGDLYLGYYVVSSRLVKISMSIALAVVITIIPKLSYHFDSDKNKYYEMMKKSTNFILLITIPMFIGINILSIDIIKLIFGENYLPAVLTLRIMSCILLIVPFANIFGLQILNISGNAKKYSQSVLLAGLVNVILNIILIKNFKNNGAAFSSIVAEIIGVIYQANFARKIVDLRKIIDKNIFKYVISAIIMGIIILLSNLIMKNKIYIFIKITIGILLYFIVLLLLKEKLVSETKLKLIEKITRGVKK